MLWPLSQRQGGAGGRAAGRSTRIACRSCSTTARCRCSPSRAAGSPATTACATRRKQAVGDAVKKHPFFGDARYDADIRKYLPATRTDPARAGTRPSRARRSPRSRPPAVSSTSCSGARTAPLRSAWPTTATCSNTATVRRGQEPVRWNIDAQDQDAANSCSTPPRSAPRRCAPRTSAIRQGRGADDQGAERRAVRSERRLEGGRYPARPPDQPRRRQGFGRRQRRHQGSWKDGTYTVVWRRKLDTGHPADDKIMKVGGVYTVGLRGA